MAGADDVITLRLLERLSAAQAAAVATTAPGAPLSPSTLALLRTSIPGLEGLADRLDGPGRLRLAAVGAVLEETRSDVEGRSATLRVRLDGLRRRRRPSPGARRLDVKA